MQRTVGPDGEVVKYRLLHSDTARGVALIELNRPHARNALTPELLIGLTTLVRQTSSNPQVGAVVITGAGKGFCAGADLKQRDTEPNHPDQKETSVRPPGEKGQHTYERLMTIFRDAVLAITNSPKPIIAAINGAAAGAGASLALACDFRVMADDAYLLQAFINIALVPDAGSSYFLVRQLGYSKALEISLEGKPIKAAKCAELGLANKIVPPQDLMPIAIAWAEQLAQKSSFCAGLTKSALHFAHTHSLADTIEYESRLQQFCVESEDHTEGRNAFLQKRKAHFTGTNMSIPCGLVARF
jgi:2-(1,2-epoxy-1,2-dihydrophenyl)acetyl-CoA isomerase